MPAQGDIYLGILGAEILLPILGRGELNISYSRIVIEEQAASGMLRRDIIASKKKYTIPYTDIDSANLAMIVAMSELNQELSIKIYSSAANFTYCQRLFMDPVEATRISYLRDGYWTGLQIVLKEV